MTLAILAAMPEELQAVLDLMPDEQRETHAGRDFWRGHLHGHAVVATLSRIGKVAAATTTALLIERYEARAVLFVGVAGGLGRAVKVGDVVVADALVQHDMDASPLFPRHEVPLYGRSRFATDAGMSMRLLAAAQRVIVAARQHLGDAAVEAFALHAPVVHHGLIASGDRFVSTDTESRALQVSLPDALAVEMEGAAVAQVCHDLDVPCAVLRTISDRADDHAHVDFIAFIRDVASRYSAAVVEAYLRGG